MATSLIDSRVRGKALATVNYIARTDHRPRYHANDTSRDTIVLDSREVRIVDARELADPPRLEREGLQLFDHASRVADFTDPNEVAAVHPDEIRSLLLQVSGADEVAITGPAILRFGERSEKSGTLDNSRPARFVHVDVSDATARAFAARSNPHPDRQPRRAVAYNVWRTFSPAPQDTPLTLCDARTVAPRDLIEADAVFDVSGAPEWSFEGWVVAASAAHRWLYASGMSRGEVWVFVTNDVAPGQPHCVPHSAFTHPRVGPDAVPRASVEMRGIAYWY